MNCDSCSNRARLEYQVKVLRALAMLSPWGMSPLEHTICVLLALSGDVGMTAAEICEELDSGHDEVAVSEAMRRVRKALAPAGAGVTSALRVGRRYALTGDVAGVRARLRL